MPRRKATTDESTGARTAEQTAAMVMGIVAIGLAALALLRGFAVFTWGTAPEAPMAADFGSGMMWMIPAIAASILAVALARADHHQAMQQSKPGQMAHMMAYIAAIVTIGLAAIGLLAAFDWLAMDTTAITGMLWGSASIVSAFVTWGFHAAVPSRVTDEDYLVQVVESRVRVAPTTAPEAAPAPRPETDRP